MQFPDNIDYLVGIDEVGRGPIAGPVTVCAALCKVKDLSELMARFPNVADSKKISQKRREEISKNLLGDNMVKFCLASMSARFIDDYGISPAIKKSLAGALSGLAVRPDTARVLLDGGLSAPSEYVDQITIIGGDSKEWLIGAASIVAKVHRDNLMVKYAEEYPDYAFEKHKGYGTKLHYERIRDRGTCKIHRVSFMSRL